MNTNNKNILYSKTVWFNALTILVVVATYFGYNPNQELAQDTSAVLLTLSPLINIGLRKLTKSGITILPITPVK